jgi:hypothetical protein
MKTGECIPQWFVEDSLKTLNQSFDKNLRWEPYLGGHSLLLLLSTWPARQTQVLCMHSVPTPATSEANTSLAWTECKILDAKKAN